MRALAQRVQADFENYKRRVDAQRAEQADRAAEEVVRSLLEVLDDCDLAASHGAEEVAPIANKLMSILERQGLSRVADTEVAFDPNVHEAVMSDGGDGDEPTVAEVMRTGYQWRMRLLRPAMVKVRS
jgi:molecular chaperone GrpE